MEWHITDAESLSIIDKEVGRHDLSPAEYEVVRRVIYATADFDYLNLIRFSNEALQAGAAALAARTTIVVDEPMVKVGISGAIQQTFSNPIYCSTEAVTRPQKERTRSAWGLETLAQRYPEGIFVIGQSQTALTSLVNLIRSREIAPALVIATPAGFVDVLKSKTELAGSLVPHIRTDSRKGGPTVAAAILDSLLDLAWQAYDRPTSKL
ncbi:MAG: precorrin-8X methylmutase [Synechococcaceae cyanobacterium RM1_1_27]|nr:precorrin-8X methylmutase [Synechococcaceae cyanobacterium SM2_3_2]NJO85630.1 precorrin-8X methylmutase [Synechococcaceae cyanobacterium RM1_1_27]